MTNTVEFETHPIEPFKCEFKDCDSITFHALNDGRLQCVQCGGWQKKTVAVNPVIMQGSAP